MKSRYPDTVSRKSSQDFKFISMDAKLSDGQDWGDVIHSAIVDSKMSSEGFKFLHDAIAQLTDKQRHVIKARFFRGYTLKQVAIE